MHIDENRPIQLLPPYTIKTRVTIMAEVQDYNHKMMNVPYMWKRTRGSGVSVAVLDTGLPVHNDLNPVGCKSFIPGYEHDLNGHSTHVGGIIAAIADNGMGVAGIAPDCCDYYGAVLDATGAGEISNISKGIYWAVDVVGAKVINMSLGIPHGADTIKNLERACNYAVDCGCTVICAAGNEGGRVGQPAVYDSVIAVAAVNSQHQHAWFSNTGRQVDFAAGGVDVYSTWLKNGYAKLDGTSMATPAIAGLVALIQADYNQTHDGWLTPNEVYNKLKKIAFDVGPEGYDESFGFGIPIFGPSYDLPDESPQAPPYVVPDPGSEVKKSKALCGVFGSFINAAAAAVTSGKPVSKAVGAGIQRAARMWNQNYRR